MLHIQWGNRFKSLGTGECCGSCLCTTARYMLFSLHVGLVYVGGASSTALRFFFFLSNTSTCQLLDKPCVTGVVPSSPRFLPSIFIAHRVQQSHCSSIFHGVLHSHAVALSASQFVRKKKSPRIYASMHSVGLELTKLTCTRLEDNLINHRGDRQYLKPCTPL